MRRTHNETTNGTYGWLALGAFVLAWDLLAEETLTHAAKRGLENQHTRPIVAAGIGITALHLLQVIPEHLDPFHQLVESRHLGKDRV
jgi:hypothetical protein